MVYDMIVKYCKENDISISAFEKKCGFGNGTVGKWNGEINPSLESLKIISKHTGIDLKKLIDA